MVFPDEDLPPSPGLTSSIVVRCDDGVTDSTIREMVEKQFPGKEIVIVTDDSLTGHDMWDPDGTLDFKGKRQRQRELFSAAYGSTPKSLENYFHKAVAEGAFEKESQCFCGKPGVKQMTLPSGKRDWVCARHARLAGDRLEPIKASPVTPANAACPCGSGKKYKRCCRLKQETP